MSNSNQTKAKIWTRPELVRLGRIGDVYGLNNGKVQANPGGKIVQS